MEKEACLLFTSDLLAPLAECLADPVYASFLQSLVPSLLAALETPFPAVSRCFLSLAALLRTRPLPSLRPQDLVVLLVQRAAQTRGDFRLF